MRKILLTLAMALSCSLTFADSSPQEQVNEQDEVRARYEVLDLMNHKPQPVEVWTMRNVREIFQSKTYRAQQVTKEAFAQHPNPRVETNKIWSREVRSRQKDTYYKETFIRDPSEFEPGQRGFGAVEERRTADDSLVRSWPIFYRAVANNDMLVIISHAFEPGNVHRITVRECDGPYIFPLHEDSMVFDGKRMISHTLYSRQD